MPQHYLEKMLSLASFYKISVGSAVHPFSRKSSENLCGKWDVGSILILFSPPNARLIFISVKIEYEQKKTNFKKQDHCA